MKRLVFLLSFLMIIVQALAQNGEIYGMVTDESNNPFPGVVVKVTQNGLLKGGTTTEDDGTYSIKPLSLGSYDIEFSTMGYAKKQVTNVILSSATSVKVNAKMLLANCMSLQAVVVTSRPPVVHRVTSISSHDLNVVATKELANLASTGANVYQSRSGSGLSIRGGRANSSVYMVDGVLIQGSPIHALATVSNNESYRKLAENDFKNVKANPLSTMSIDVDHASYANIRRMLNDGYRPPTDAVRIEEMVNYFEYNYPQPEAKDPISMTTELIECPWNSKNMLLKIGLQAKTVDTKHLPPANIVFLIDVSGSMESEDKLPLLKSAFMLLTDQLRAQDKVSIIVYAGNSGMVLPPTSGADKAKIKDVLSRLEAGGSTAGGAGIQLAYKVAVENFIKGGNNRVVLATDGDFNVGITNDADLEKLVTSEKEKGVFLSCLGFGEGNYKDARMELLADKGNGNYNYIDNLEEAKKTLVKEFGGTIFTIAKDVKTQIEFNPEKVKGYRLIGYENRVLNTEDFKDDKKDAGDLGSGHSVTILYELVPAKSMSKDVRPVGDLKYQKVFIDADPAKADELATIKFRYKAPDENVSKELEHIVYADVHDEASISLDTRFSASVALFGMLLSDSKYLRSGDYSKVLALANSSLGEDKESYRKEFVGLVEKAKGKIK